MAKKVITFGEIMLRLAPDGYYRFVQAESLGATYGGGEANVAVSLANYGMDAAFVTKVPKHEIGQCAVNSLRRYGVDTSYMVRGGNRLGIYFLEKGASQRPSKVIYDRAGSSMAEATTADFNWDEIFEGADWFHVDVCIANEEDASDVFGIKAAGTDVTSGKLNHDGYKDVAKQLADRFGFQKVAITLRESISANDNMWAAMLYDGNDYYFSKKYPMHIVDRVGGGDSFGGGLIYSCLTGFEPQQTIEFAVAASCLKHSIEGDFNQVSVDEVMKLAGGDGSGRVQR